MCNLVREILKFKNFNLNTLVTNT